jgi:hypothetical protein
MPWFKLFHFKDVDAMVVGGLARLYSIGVKYLSTPCGVYPLNNPEPPDRSCVTLNDFPSIQFVPKVPSTLSNEGLTAFLLCRLQVFQSPVLLVNYVLVWDITLLQ